MAEGRTYMFVYNTIDWTIIFPILNVVFWSGLGVLLVRWLRKK